MASQIKFFTNGVKAILREQRGKKPALLQIFDSENCMVAQREIKSNIQRDGSRKLEKISLRQAKEGQNQIEYMSTIAENSGAWNSYRAVLPECSDDVFINQHVKFSNLTSMSEYHKEFTNNCTALNFFGFPLKKPSTHPMSKLEELRATLDKMYQQWYNPQTGELRESVKPMMSSSVKKEFNI